MTFRFNSIKTKLLLTLLTFGLIPFLVISAYSIRSFKTKIQEEIVNKLLLFVDAKADELFAYFGLVEARTLDFASDGLVRDFTESFLFQHDSESLDQLQNHLILNKKPLDSTLLAIAILDLDGRILASTDTAYAGRNHRNTDYFQAGLKEIFIREIQEPSSGKNAFLVAAPLKSRQDQVPLGVLINFFDAQKLISLFSGQLGFDPKGQFLLGGSSLQTLEVYIVNQKEEMFVHPLRSSHEADMKVSTLPVTRCFDSKQAVGGEIYSNYAGQKVMGVSVCFPEKNWVILSEITRKEAFAPLSALYLRLGLMIAFLFFTIILIALVLSRRVTEPLELMTGEIRRVREGDLSVRLKVSRSDEIGELMTAFNAMAEKLKKLYGSLEKKVQEKTKKLHEKVIKIEQEKAKDEAILESIGDGMILTDAEGNIVTLNQAAEQVLEWKFASKIGQPLYTALPLEDETERPLSAEQHPLHVVLSRAKKVEGVYYYRDHGEKFPIRITLSPVILGKAIKGTIMVFHDVTKEKEVERMKNEFVSLVSHQLRTPLSGMKWFAEMFLSGDLGALNAEQKEFIGHISELNERMIDLVNALLNISRIESGRIIIEPKPTHLGALVSEVLTALKTKIQEKQLNLVVSINEELPLISIDPKLIREVYSNLLSNAIKYTPAGGDIHVFISENDREIISQISDTGYGIPAHEQSKVFKKFFRGSNVISVETDGNGLGLYLVKAIVESSGGAIRFKSAEKKGTSFWFSLPRSGTKPRKGEVALNT